MPAAPRPSTVPPKACALENSAYPQPRPNGNSSPMDPLDRIPSHHKIFAPVHREGYPLLSRACDGDFPVPIIRLQTNKNTALRQTPKGSERRSLLGVAVDFFCAGVRPVRSASPWNLMAIAFALHLVAGMLVKGFLTLHRVERLVPMSALALGLGYCLWAQRHNWKAHQKAWMRLVPALLYSFFIAAMSHQPLTGVRLPVSADLFHPVEYACLAVLWGWFCLPVLSRRGSLAFAGWILVPGILFALSDEWHQSWVPGRFSSVWDVVLDAVGLCAGTAAVMALSRWAPLWNPALWPEPNQVWTKVRVTARSP